MQFAVDGVNFGGVVALDGTGHAMSAADPFLSGASHTVKAVYTNLDGNFKAGPAGTLTQTVQTVARESDPLNPALTDLFVGGSAASNHVDVKLDKGQITVDLHDGQKPTTTPLAGLTALVVYGQAKGEHIQVDKQLTLPAFLFAGNGADAHIEGGGGPTVEIGGSGGNAHLEGGAGRNILIAGPGGGHLEGQGGDDILIGGYTDYDHNLAALMSIMAEWNSADAFATRTAALSSCFSTSTVHDDGVSDHLEGGGGMNWVFAKLTRPDKDSLDGMHRNDTLVDI